MRIFKLVKLDFNRFVRNKKNFAVMMFLPILVIMLFYIALNCYNKGTFKKLEVGIVNLDRDSDTELILSVIRETQSIKEVINFNEFTKLQEMTKAVNDKRIDCGIMIPHEFMASIYNNDKGEISFYRGEKLNVQTMLFKNLVYEVVELADYMRDSLDVLWESMKDSNIPYENRAQIYEKEAKALIMNMVVRDTMFTYENSTTIFVYYFVYFILVFMYVNLIIMYRNTTSEDEGDIMQRLAIMNYKKSHFLMSRAIVCIFLQFIVNIVLIGAALLYLKVNIITTFINILVITIYNGMFVVTVLNIVPYRNASFITLISMLALMIFDNGAKILNPLSRSLNLVFDTLRSNNFGYYRSILLSVAAMILINILIVMIKKYFIIRKGGVFNEKVS